MTMAVKRAPSSATALGEDARARQRALEMASFIVQAPAGSGKTELLTQRFLKLLAHVAHPEEVVALTFTNKAATEMRHRILASLERAARDECPTDDLPHKQLTFALSKAVLRQDAQHHWDLLQHPGRLKITTIDALCNSLVRQMPFLSRFGAPPQVATDATLHYQAAARETLALVEGDDAYAELANAALRYFDNDAGRLSALIAGMLAQRDQWHRFGESEWASARDRAAAGLRDLIQRDLEIAALQIRADTQHAMMAPARFASASYAPAAALGSWTQALTGDLADLPRWRALACLLLANNGHLRRKLTKDCGFPPKAVDPASTQHKAALLAAMQALSPAAAAHLQRITQLPDLAHADEEWDIIAPLSQLLVLAEALLLLEFQRAGAVDFIAIAQSAIEALGTDNVPTDLALALDYRIQHLLIDEFQDTSPTQVALIAGLTRGWHTQDYETRTLFLVGDPMQSIYRFRKAEVGLFLDVAANGIGAIKLQHLQLVRNNRSDPTVVDWINTVFPAVFPEQSNAHSGAVSYAPCATDKPATGAAQIRVHPAIGGSDDADAKQAEALSIISIIEAARQHDPGVSIGVLVRAKAQLDELTATLRRLRPDLPYQAVEIETLDERQSVQDLLALTQALLHRADRVHWLAVLRAPWCGLTLADLHALAADDHERTIWQLMQDDIRVSNLSSDGRRRLLHARAVLGQALQHQGRLPLRRWVEQTWRRLGGAQCLATPADAPDVDAYFSLLEQVAQRTTVDVDVLRERMKDLYAQPNPVPAALQIQLMSVHKSKGLEFDCVILPGLDSPRKAGDRELLRWETVDVPGNGKCVIPAAIGRKGSAPTLPSIYDFLGVLDNDREQFELQRLLYVAATRARRSLHLLGTVKRSKETASTRQPDADPAPIQAPSASSMLGLMWEGPVGVAFTAAALAHRPAPSNGSPAPDKATFVPQLRRLNAEAIHVLAETAERDRIADAHAAVVDHDELGDSNNLYAAVGTLVHRCLEIVANEGLEKWPLARCAALKPAYQAWLRSQGHGGNAPDVGADLVLQALATTLNSDTGRWILQQRDDAQAERPLTSLAGDGTAGVAHHIVDRTFVEAGCRWIIDYKTVRYDNADVAAYLSQHAEKNYMQQLERYVSLFVHEGRPIRAAVFYVLQGYLAEITKPDAELTAQLAS
jgi:ATP-dependent exoDNAse (exonuclease V) beta subunit